MEEKLCPLTLDGVHHQIHDTQAGIKSGYVGVLWFHSLPPVQKQTIGLANNLLVLIIMCMNIIKRNSAKKKKRIL